MKLILIFALLFCGDPTDQIRKPSPEQTLQKYFSALNSHDQKTIRECFDPNRDCPNAAYVKDTIVHHKILKKVTLSAEFVRKNQFVPPSRVGDIRIDVRQYYGDQYHMDFSYFFRLEGKEWLIYSFSAWGVD